MNRWGRRRRKTVDIMLSIFILVAIGAVGYYLLTIINSGGQLITNYTATITLVWRNVPPQMGDIIRIGDPVLSAGHPAYVVVAKSIKPYPIPILTPSGMLTASSPDVADIHLTIKSIEPLTSTTPPLGGKAALLGDTVQIESYLWEFTGMVIGIETATTMEIPTRGLGIHVNQKPGIDSCLYVYIARNLQPEVIEAVKANRDVFDIFGKRVMKVEDIKILHPHIFGWIPQKGIVIAEDPYRSDLLLYLKPTGKEKLPIQFNGKPLKVGIQAQLRGENWRLWGRIIDIVCGK